jgi:hypothetical protein
MRLTSDFLPLPVCLMANHKLPMVFGYLSETIVFPISVLLLV